MAPWSRSSSALVQSDPGQPRWESETEMPDIETSSEQYARRFSGSVGRYFLEVQTRTVLQLLEPFPGARILDVGGGHAQLAVPLARRGFDVTVVGSSDRCRRRLEEQSAPRSISFYREDLLNLSFVDNAFDVVLAFRLMPHLRAWPNLVAELCRVAREAIVVDYPDWQSFNVVSRFLFGAKKSLEGNTRPYHCFHRREVLAEFARGGFSSPTLRPQFFLPMVLHRVVGVGWMSRSVEAFGGWCGLTRIFGSPVILCVTPS